MLSDMIDFSLIEVVNSRDVLLWPITTNLTALDITASGINPEFDKESVWPEVIPKGWDGPITHTLWLFLNIGGWIGSGIIQYYRGLTYSGGAIWNDNQIAKNWVYDSRWGRMMRYQPSPGEVIGFMVAAGNQRGQFDQSVQERSNIVTLAMPSGPQRFEFENKLTPVPDKIPDFNPLIDIEARTDKMMKEVSEILRILQPYKRD